MSKRNCCTLVLAAGLIMMVTGVSYAETFRVPAGTIISAAKDGATRHVTWSKAAGITGADFYVGNGKRGGYIFTLQAKTPNLNLFDVPKNGARFQLRQGEKWLYISPDGKDGLTLRGIRRACENASGCALEVIL